MSDSSNRNTYVYDGVGRLTCRIDPPGPVISMVYDGRGVARPPKEAQPPSIVPPPDENALFTRTLEFRLSGSEEQTQSFALPPHWPKAGGFGGRQVFSCRSP